MDIISCIRPNSNLNTARIQRNDVPMPRGPKPGDIGLEERKDRPDGPCSRNPPAPHDWDETIPREMVYY